MRCNVSPQLELVVFHSNVEATATVLVSGCFPLFPTSCCILVPILNSQEPFQIGLANCHRSQLDRSLRYLLWCGSAALSWALVRVESAVGCDGCWECPGPRGVWAPLVSVGTAWGAASPRKGGHVPLWTESWGRGRGHD